MVPINAFGLCIIGFIAQFYLSSNMPLIRIVAFCRDTYQTPSTVLLLIVGMRPANCFAICNIFAPLLRGLHAMQMGLRFQLVYAHHRQLNVFGKSSQRAAKS